MTSDNTTPPLAVEAAERPSIKRVIGSVAFLVGWGLLHYVIFILLAASGIVVEVLLSLVKTFLFPGRALHAQALDLDTWLHCLTASVIVAGVAGIPLSLGILWSHRKKVMRRTFWLMYVGGIAVGAISLIRFIISIFTA